MIVMNYDQGTTITATLGPVVKIYDTKNVYSNAEVMLESHALMMAETQNICTDTWEGQRMRRRSWDPGGVAFLPMNSQLRFAPEISYDEKVIELSDRLFVEASKDSIDHSRIEFRFADVTSKPTVLLAQSVAHVSAISAFSDWPLLIESNALALVIAVICMLSPNATTAFKNKPYGMSDFRKKKVFEYIDANIHRQISLAELADTVNLSQFHFSRKFKNAVGVSPLAYLANRRVDMAKKMIRSRSEKLSEVAYSCGFASQSHLTTVFKTVTGTTPAAYRKSTADV